MTVNDVRTDRGPTRGVYVAVFHLAAPRRITVGRLGRFDFAAGFYFYVGSAQRGLQARLARHGRGRKPQRWHIDYLSAVATMLGAVALEAPQACECRLARALAAAYACPIARFGASDCHCPGHVFYCAPEQSRRRTPSRLGSRC